MTWVEVSEEGYWSLNNPPPRNSRFGWTSCLCIDGEFVQYSGVCQRKILSRHNISLRHLPQRRRGFAPGPLASLADLKVVPRGRSQPPSLWNPYTRSVRLGRSFPDARGMMSALGSCVRSRAGRQVRGLAWAEQGCNNLITTASIASSGFQGIDERRE